MNWQKCMGFWYTLFLSIVVLRTLPALLQRCQPFMFKYASLQFSPSLLTYQMQKSFEGGANKSSMSNFRHARRERISAACSWQCVAVHKCI